MQKKTKIILGAVAALFLVALGRFTAPEKVVIETQIVEKKTEEKKEDTKTKRDKKTKKIITEITFPDGRKEVRTEIVEDTSTTRETEKETNTDVVRNENTTKTVTSRSDRLRLSALVGADLRNGINLETPVFGAHIDKRFLGPITIGLWGLSNRSGGVSLGLEF